MVGKFYEIYKDHEACDNFKIIEDKTCSILNVYLWQVSDGVNSFNNIVMMNSECKMQDHPVDRNCDKSWRVVDFLGNWRNDRSITLMCKNWGK